MADISVHIFVQNLRELMKSRHPKISGEKDQLESLYKDVILMSSFIKKIEEKRSFDDEKVNNLVTEIRELVLEAEYIVDLFMMEQRDFELLKVLQVDEAVELLYKIENLAHPRYLGVLQMFFDLETAFISSVTKLLYLETLYLRTIEAINIPDDIWNMVKLRHLYNKQGIFHFKA